MVVSVGLVVGEGVGTVPLVRPAQAWLSFGSGLLILFTQSRPISPEIVNYQNSVA